ncbi:uncharacterized protein LOC144319543 [Canis aureus]
MLFFLDRARTGSALLSRSGIIYVLLLELGECLCDTASSLRANQANLRASVILREACLLAKKARLLCEKVCPPTVAPGGHLALIGGRLRERGCWPVNLHVRRLYLTGHITHLALWFLFITFFELDWCQFTPKTDGAVSRCPENRLVLSQLDKFTRMNEN